MIRGLDGWKLYLAASSRAFNSALAASSLRKREGFLAQVLGSREACLGHPGPIQPHPKEQQQVLQQSQAVLVFQGSSDLKAINSCRKLLSKELPALLEHMQPPVCLHCIRQPSKNIGSMHVCSGRPQEYTVVLGYLSLCAFRVCFGGF